MKQVFEMTVKFEDEAELVEALENAVNGGVHGGRIEDEVGGIHRYLQQEMFDEIIRPLVVGIAQQGTDARNERAVKQAQQIVDAMDW